MDRWLRVVVMMLLTVAFGDTALAAPPSECGSFTVYSDGSARKVTYVDQTPDGTSAGDQRIGYRAIKDSFGDQVGEFRWTATVVEVAQSADQQDQTAAEGVFVFPAGHIVFVRPAAPVFAPPETTEKVAGNGDYIVVGGSGAFQGASGIAQRPARGKLAQSYAFDIRCD